MHSFVWPHDDVSTTSSGTSCLTSGMLSEMIENFDPLMALFALQVLKQQQQLIIIIIIGPLLII